MDIFNKLCRSCNIEKRKLLNINNKAEFFESITIKEMLEFCLQTTITNESKYPNVICYDCIKQLEISYRFLKRFKLTQCEFDETYNRLQSNNKDRSGNVCITENTIDGAIVEDCTEISQKSCEDIVYQTQNVVEVVDKHFEKIIPMDTGKASEKMASIKSLANLPVLNITPTTDNLPAMICSHCNKTFFTTKALNLHLKLSHKQKI